MSDRDLGDETIELQHRLDQLCDEFERLWKEGQRPRIEEFLPRVASSVRGQLVIELLALDLDFRRSSGEPVSEQEYLRRLTDFTAEVEEAFRAAVASDALSSDSKAKDTSVDEAAVRIRERIGRYRIESKLGEGAFGQVYLAIDDELDRQVAIKVPHRHRVGSQRNVELYLKEARTLASLDHANIVPVYDFGHTPDGLCYLVSKLIDGSDLARLLATTRLPQSEAVRIVLYVAEALHYAHTHGLVHRDIKPANILVDANNLPYITDFGLALREEDFGKFGPSAGTPAYMSPEQARGEGHRVDGRTDVYSLGVVLYELLTGRRPFRGSSVPEILEEISFVDVRPPRQIDDSVAPELERICLKALSRRALDRYTTARDLADDLTQYFRSVESKPVSQTAVREDSVPPTITGQTATETHPAGPAGQSELPATPTIIPRGLRSFDATDADFFLQLLPGVRDRTGLPEAIRFWKDRIESFEQDRTFPVGLLYGPSGCGKSSLVQAGLLPHLGESVLAVYVEAGAENTEDRLLSRLRQQIPTLPQNENLVDSMASVRRSTGSDHGKVLIVLDQFEQWLHAHASEPNPELTQALRQCDGRGLQCLILVRDDFWLSISRFMRALEIRIVEGRNSMLVDLFDPRHAQEVLAAFGRAYGRLPENPAAQTAEQESFLQRAVDGLAEDHKIACIRLALFSEMMKNRPWTSDELKAMGGISGIGVRFFDEMFSSASAPLEHRIHREATQGLLKSLLPEAGTQIRGHLVSRDQMRAASGYDHPRDFEELLGILDGELRLITPTDPATTDGGDELEARHYQLAHDYLIPSLRAWLLREQKETLRGRTQLLLEERADLWSAKPEPRNLPSLWEFVKISQCVPGRDLSASQQRMMRSGRRRYGMWAACAVVMFALLATGGVLVQGELRERQSIRASNDLIARLATAEIDLVPEITARMRPYQRWVLPRLETAFDEAAAEASARRNLALALVDLDRQQHEFLFNEMLQAEADEFMVICDSLEPQKQQLIGSLWNVATDEEQPRAQRFRAACALATYDANAAKWREIAPAICEQLVVQNPQDIGRWVAALRPAEGWLIKPLGEVFRDPKRPEPERLVATSALSGYAAGAPGELVDLLLDADAKQFQLLIPKLTDAERVVPLLEQELAKDPKNPGWNDAPLEENWPEPNGNAVAAIQRSQGIVEGRFAFCQTMPVEEATEVAETLRDAGYRPFRFRPYTTTDKSIQTAVIWRRDGREWRLAQQLSAEEMRAENVELEKQGFEPVDVAAYLGAPAGPTSESASLAARYAAVWVRKQTGQPDSRMYVGLTTEEHDADLMNELYDDGYHAITFPTPLRVNGEEHFSAVWAQSENDLERRRFKGYEPEYSADMFTDLLQTEVRLFATKFDAPVTPRFAAELDYAQERLEARRDDTEAQFTRATALYQLGRYAEAVKQLSQLIRVLPDAAPLYRYRALAQAALGESEKAKLDIARHRALSEEAEVHAYLEAVVAVKLETLENHDSVYDYLQKHFSSVDKPEFLYEAACAFAEASGHFSGDDPGQVDRCAERAAELLGRSLELGYTLYYNLQMDPRLDALRGRADFRELLESQKLDRSYAALWAESQQFDSESLHGLAPDRHRIRCRELVSSDFRPHSLTAWSAADGSLVSASVWHRQKLSTEESEQLARRQANALVALVWLGRNVPVELMRDANPSRQSHLVHALGPMGVDVDVVISWLKEYATLRRPLILSLGEYSDEQLTASRRTKLISMLLEIYREDPDPGVHGAADWLLRKWTQGEAVQAIDRELATGEPEGNRRWYVNKQGQTMLLVTGPIEFQMGSPITERDRDEEEVLHYVRIPRSFEIGAKEVTIEDFQRFLKEEPRVDHEYSSRFSPDDHGPQVAVTWYEAVAYCNWLSKKEGLGEADLCYETNAQGLYAGGMSLASDYLTRAGYRLPTESEWECACRAGNNSRRYYGEAERLLGKYEWYLLNSEDRAWPVGSLKPNGWGLFDMLGNVGEWCSNRGRHYSRNTSATPFVDDGEGLQVVEDRDPRGRVLRGGSFLHRAEGARSADHAWSLPNVRTIGSGFRVARTGKPNSR